MRYLFIITLFLVVHGGAVVAKDLENSEKSAVTGSEETLIEDMLIETETMETEDEMSTQESAETSSIEISKKEAHTMARKNELVIKQDQTTNHMQVVVVEKHTTPEVSVHLFYRVGSKNENTGERGLAHLIEHMIFKGTKKLLSESDINIITHMLSGSTNAFTSYDYTGYLFNMPTQHWKEVLPIMADCMQNAAFKNDHLNSEMKAVIQELKMGRDNYRRTLWSDVLTTLLPDHPYHYTIIGFKQDLWNVHAADLHAFYKKHYWPNNATLVIVGDVNAEEVFDLAEKYFGKIPANPSYEKEKFYHNADIVSRELTLYRDVKQPLATVSYLLPGSEHKNEHLLSVLEILLGDGKGSRLYKRIVDEEKLAVSLSSFVLPLFEHSMLMIAFEPKKVEDIEQIIQLIEEEIADIVENGLTDLELTRAIKHAQMSYYGLLESISSLAYEIGKTYLATGDAEYALTFLDEDPKKVEKDIQALLKEYVRPTVMAKGLIMPLPEEEKVRWLALQKQADETDKKFLEARGRTTPIEPPLYANHIVVKEPAPFSYPKAEKFTLENGITVLVYDNETTPKIDILIDLKAEPYYDSDALPGLYEFTMGMLLEGTKKYTAQQLVDEFDRYGISLSLEPGHIHMSLLRDDLEKGLELLQEVLQNPRFDEEEMEKVREQLLVNLKNFWDEPKRFATQLLSEKLYRGHPYSKNTHGTEKSLKVITRKDLIAFHKKYIAPAGSRMALVGDLKGLDVKKILHKTIGAWHGPSIEALVLPALESMRECEIIHPINRDQVILCFAGLSVDRLHPDYDKLLLFDQIFGGGALGSLHSKLYQLREQSGLFYNIYGSLISGASEAPGAVIVRTMVSLDRLDEAEKAIKKTIETTLSTITEHEFDEARRAILNAMVSTFSSNRGIARAFLFLQKYGLPADYFDKRGQQLAQITLKDMKEAVARVLNPEALFTLKIGRLEKKK